MRPIQLLTGVLLIGLGLTATPQALRAQDAASERQVYPLSKPSKAEQQLADLRAKLAEFDGPRWIRHVKEELLPFWMMPEALGNPVGNFPTYRCNDGSLYDEKSPCPELKTPAFSGIVFLDRDYVRAKSRQIYAYGVAYHMTGDEQYLKLMKAGVDYIRANALQRKDGKLEGSVSYFEGTERRPAPERLQRTSQDLAYAATGIGFYYYLTRDPDVRKDLVDLKNYIFETYFDPRQDIFVWVKERSRDDDLPGQRELVAQLDQVYGYMMWTAHALPQADREQWKRELSHLARLMIEQFYTPRDNMMWGRLPNPDIPAPPADDPNATSPETRAYGKDHMDFGHTVKTLWLIYQIGKLNGDLALTEFGRVNAARVLEAAYIERNGSWARRIDGDFKLDEAKEWWILCELDQVAGTLSLIDPMYAKYLPGTYRYWFNYMVDKQHHEVWHWVDADGWPDKLVPKAHSWKNALHSFEHALVAYIAAQRMNNQPVTLYFAFKDLPKEDEIEPYFFQGSFAAPPEKTPSGYKVVFGTVR